MWPAKSSGEDARLYQAVKAVSDFALKLGINIPTGKDSLSMTQKYPDNEVVIAPGTVIISAVGEVIDITKTVCPVLEPIEGSKLIYLNLSQDTFKLGGSSFAQVLNLLGNEVPTVRDETYFGKAFETVQHLIKQDLVLAGHDVSEGGVITALLEMCFAVPGVGLTLNIDDLGDDLIKILFNENPAVILQVREENEVLDFLNRAGITVQYSGTCFNKA